MVIVEEWGKQNRSVRRRTSKGLFVLEEVIKHSPPSLEGHRMHDERLVYQVEADTTHKNPQLPEGSR